MNPVLAEVTRGPLVESWHRGALVALDSTGSAVVRSGDTAAALFPRSTAKPFQLAAMLHAGLADLPGLDEAMLAIGTASHSGEKVHRDAVRRLLAAAGLTEEQLGNVPALPMAADERQAWRAAGRPASRLAMECSGKHAAMLATCVVRGWPIGGYLDPAHPLQAAILAHLENIAGTPAVAVSVDGCGAPLRALSLDGLAAAFGSLVTAPAGTPEHRVAAAMRAHPELVGGSGRDVTRLMQVLPGLIAKDGVEGLYVVALADGSCVALKIEDGGMRACVPVLVAALSRLGVNSPELTALAHAPVYGGGRAVGEVRAVADLRGEG